jgi:hypothetical protein
MESAAAMFSPVQSVGGFRGFFGGFGILSLGGSIAPQSCSRRAMLKGKEDD